MPKKIKNTKIQTNYGTYLENAACRKFIKQNKQWRDNDPIGFELELINRFAVTQKPNPKNINLNEIPEE